MKISADAKSRVPIGRVSTDTKGPPGVFMEGAGLWNSHKLTD